MAEVEKIVGRSKKVAFMKVGEVYTRMTKFTSMSRSSNPTEYSRQYIDEDGEVTDVTGYSPSIDYAFDEHTNNLVHQAIKDITEEEKTGADAIVTIAIADMTSDSAVVRYRDYAVIPSSDGDSTDAYTYSGTFKAKSSAIKTTGTVSDDGKTLTLSPTA